MSQTSTYLHGYLEFCAYLCVNLRLVRIRQVLPLSFQRQQNDLTESDDLPEEDTEAPTISLLAKGVVIQRLWRHPPDRQSTLADGTGNIQLIRNM